MFPLRFIVTNTRRDSDVISTPKPVCPDCHGFHRQTKAGMAVNGNQRYQCQDCKRFYVGENRRFRYSADVRAKAVEMHSNGLAYRHIARLLDVNHQTVSNWITIASFNKQYPGTERTVRAPTY